MEIVPFADEHLDAAAEMLAARHARHRAAEPLLPADVDFRAQVASEWSADGASGVISPHGYLFGRPRRARAHGRDRRPRGHRRCRARARPLRRGGRGVGRGRTPLAHGLRPVERRSADRRVVPAELRRLGRARHARDRRGAAVRRRRGHPARNAGRLRRGRAARARDVRFDAAVAELLDAALCRPRKRSRRNGAKTTSPRTSSSSPSETGASSATSSSTGGRPTFASPRTRSTSARRRRSPRRAAPASAGRSPRTRSAGLTSTVTRR